MKLKKFFAGVVAAAMMLTMGATAAFAAGNTNDSTIVIGDKTYSDAQTVTIKKTYKLVGAGKNASETFTLEQVGNGAVKDGDKTYTVPALGTITGATFAENTATTNGATGNITIALPAYAKAGVYEYTLKEVAMSATAGVSYYSKNIKLVVSVVNGSNGTLRVAAVHAEGSDDDDKTDTFTNTYTANTISVSKTVTGNLGDKTKEFSFKIDFEKAANEAAPTLITYTIDDDEKTVAFDSNGKASVEFTLHDGQTLNFVNVPKGVKYTVSETSYASEGYKTYLNNSKDEVRTSGEQTMDDKAASYAFTNEKGADIDTGVILDNAPYIALMAIVVFGGVALMLNKRRRDEE